MSGSRITSLEALDVRFPTSITLAGSDAMNVAPDYSATYVTLKTDRADSLAGHGLTFTIGRGNEVVVAAARALRPLVVGNTVEQLRALCREAVNAGWTHVKMKVGRDIEDDVRRARIAREVLVPDRKLMKDANQVWDVGEAIANTRRLA